MRDVAWEISKEEFDGYVKLSTGELNALIEPRIPIDWMNGYGWYGCHVRATGDKYYLVHRIGSHCD